MFLLRWLIFFPFFLPIYLGFSQDGYISGKPALAYWQVGEKKETIIVLHGGPAVQHDYLRPEFDALKQVGKVIYYDQRGCGKSEQAADKYTWQDHVKDLKRVVDTFSKGEKVVLAGSSWGSMLAILFAYAYPEEVKALILSGTVKWGGEGVSEKDFQPRSYRHLQVNREKRTFLEYKTIPIELDDKKIHERIVIKKEYEIFYGGPHLQPMETIFTAPAFSSLKQVSLPVLIFNGDREPCTTEKDWGKQYVKIFPQAKLHTIIGACHDPWFANPQEFFAVSRKFVLALSSP